jgi:hypothetical protein
MFIAYDLLWGIGPLDSAKVFHSWEEAQKAVPFTLREPPVLPAGTKLDIIGLLQPNCYLDVLAWHTVDFLGWRNGTAFGESRERGVFVGEVFYEDTFLGDTFLLLYQHYLGPDGSVVFDKEPDAETITVGGIDILHYVFTLRTHGDYPIDFGLIVLHWVQDDILFRLMAISEENPTITINDIPVGFSIDDLLPIAEGLILNP